MQDHPSFEQLNLYERRALRPELFLSVHRHVSGCPQCSEQCGVQPAVKEDYAILVSALLPASDDEPYHLLEPQVAGYVERTVDDVTIELVESHLEVCAECTRAVEELREATPLGSLPMSDSDGGRVIQYATQKSGTGFLPFLTTQARRIQISALLLLILSAILVIVLVMRARLRQSPPPPISLNPIAGPGDNPRDPLPSKQVERRPSEDQATTSPAGKSTRIGPSKQRPFIVAAVVVGSNGGGIAADRRIRASLRREIITAWTSQGLERPAVLAGLKGVSGRLLSDSGNGVPFQLLSPLGKVVQTRRPAFAWKPVDGATSYLVTVVDDKLEEVASSGRLTETKWIPLSLLKRGHTYSWQVTAFKDGQRITSPVMPAPEAKFRTLDRKQNKELKGMKRLFPNYHLGLGVFYTRLGLLDEAEQEFEALLMENPDSVGAQSLLQSVRSMKQ